MTRSEPTIQTRDLTLATFLIAKGCDFRMVSDGTNSTGAVIGAWVFPETELTRSLVTMFEKGEARIEPKKFHSALSSARRSLFTFLDASR